MREMGESHHDHEGGSRKLSAVATGHTMQVKEKHYERVGEDFEQVRELQEISSGVYAGVVVSSKRVYF
jgi:hypothetical protein